ncbi:angiopoietin-2-like [Emydura macquarii macquarii]|uniref:angiopoietin-2-like n=1 Tax=Emydura macquarii macquarii TaxID=1129001 RepID=UPI00352A3531
MGAGGALPWLMLAARALLALGLGSPLKGKDGLDRPQHRVQHGPCSYTFLLPEIGGCHPSAAEYPVSNSLQRDAPSLPEPKWPAKRLQQLENVLENNTQWLQKLENYIQENVKMEMAEIQLHAVQNHTTAMMEIGSSLTRKLTEVETQVLNQTSRLEIQMLENSLSTSKLEKQLLLQTQEINKLQEKNSFLEKKVLDVEGKHAEELQGIQAEKLEMRGLLSKQSQLIQRLEQHLTTAAANQTVLQRQQASLLETVHRLMGLASQCNQISPAPKDEQKVFRDCGAAYKSGLSASGVYTLRFPNSTATTRAFCDMETSGGGWTVIQHRKDGSVDFHRTWKEYKHGFGSPSGEYWLGNDFIHQLTTQGSYSLRIQLRDWDSNEAYSLYEHFHLAGEEQSYRLHAWDYSGTAGRTSSLSLPGMAFSTKDADHDRCSCKCAQMATGGWWFDACGPSNLNGIYYPASPTTGRYNGMKWHYWKGPSHRLRATTMMIRPADF